MSARPACALKHLLALWLLISCAACQKNETELSVEKHERALPMTLFEDRTDHAGIHFSHQIADGRMDNIMESNGAGGAVFDYNNDGFMDVYLVNSGPAPILSSAPSDTVRFPNKLFRNNGDGTFHDITSEARVEGHGFGTTAAAADYDNDGFTDLLVVNFNSLILYHNQGDGTFEDLTEAAGLVSKQPAISATWVDVENDGHLDLFVANYLKFDPSKRPPAGSSAPYPGPLAYESELNVLYKNRGDGTFEDISEKSGIRIPGHRAMSATAFDYDLDGDQDIYVSNDGTPNLLLENDGKGTFKDVALARGAAFNQFGEAAGSMGATIGDVNADGFLDMFVTRFGNASLYLNSRGYFEDKIHASGILAVTTRYTGWGGNFLDVENDGDLDVLLVNGHAHFLEPMPTLLLLNDGLGAYGDANPDLKGILGKPQNGRGCLVADFQNRGLQSIIITTLGGAAVLLENISKADNHWLSLQLVGTRGNRSGLGAKIRVVAGGRVQQAETRCPTSYVSQSDPRTHFGLGSSDTLELVEIRWPSGQVQTLNNVRPDQVLQVIEPGVSRWQQTVSQIHK